MKKALDFQGFFLTRNNGLKIKGFYVSKNHGFFTKLFGIACAAATTGAATSSAGTTAGFTLFIDTSYSESYYYNQHCTNYESSHIAPFCWLVMTNLMDNIQHSMKKCKYKPKPRQVLYTNWNITYEK